MPRTVDTRLTKMCKECGEEKPVTEYDRHRARCKECRSFLNAEYYRTKRNDAILKAEHERYLVMKNLEDKMNN